MRNESQTLFAACGYSYPNSEAPDMVLFSLSEKGKLHRVAQLRRGDNPSFLAHRDGVLYVCCENEGNATIAAYRVNEGGFALRHEHRLDNSGVCHIVERDGIIYGSGYLDGIFFGVEAESGKLAWRFRNAEAAVPRAHWISFSEDGNWLFGADLGSDAVYVFPIAHGLPLPSPSAVIHTANKAGPRQPLPHGDRLYVVNQDDHTVGTYDISNPAKPRFLKNHDATTTKRETYCAGSVIAGSRVFVPNRGPDTITMFDIQACGDLLRAREEPLDGSWTRSVIITRDGRFLLAAHEKSGRISCLEIIEGELRPRDTMALLSASCITQIE